MAGSMPSRKEYQKNRKFDPPFGFCYIPEDMRETESWANKYLREHPTHAVNLGDGKGLRCGKKYKGWLPKREEFIFQKVKKGKKKVIGKRGKSINMSGLTYEDKVKQVKKLIRKAFDGELPEHITFKPVKIRSGSSKASPDGLRMLVYIHGLQGGQSNVDKDGKFGIDRCINKIQETEDQ